MDYFRVKRDLPEIGPEILGEFMGLPITNSFIMVLVTMSFIIALTVFAKRTFSVANPSKFQIVVESVYGAIKNTLEQMTGSSRIAGPIIPLVMTLFTFFAICNLFTLIPGFANLTFETMTSEGVRTVPLLRAPSSDFNVTFGVAFTLWIIIQIASIVSWGPIGYVGRFIKIKELYLGFRKGIGAGSIAIVEFLIGLLDIISELAKPISLSLRLFGNIFAGAVLMSIIMGFFAVGLPTVWHVMSLVFGLVQAVVFAILVAAYYSTSLKPEDETEVSPVGAP